MVLDGPLKRCTLGDSMRRIVGFVSSATRPDHSVDAANTLVSVAPLVNCSKRRMAYGGYSRTNSLHTTLFGYQGEGVCAVRGGCWRSRW